MVMQPVRLSERGFYDGTFLGSQQPVGASRGGQPVDGGVIPDFARARTCALWRVSE
jgi:hypothetical protein